MSNVACLAPESLKNFSTRKPFPESGLHEITQAILQLLPPVERHLILLHQASHCSYRDIAAQTGLSVGAVYRRIQRIENNLRLPVVAALALGAQGLSETYRQIGLAHYLAGVSIRALAREFDRSKSEINSILAFVQAWTDARTRYCL